MAEKYVYGIKLGSTYSSIACVEGNKDPHPQAKICIDPMTKCAAVPSVVRFKENGTTIVGELAKQHSVVYPEDVVTLDKMMICEEEFVHYGLKMDKAVSRVDICAEILKKLIEIASAMEDGIKVKSAMIAIPLYYRMYDKAVIIEAGRRVGLETIQLIDEPIAAVINYGLSNKEKYENVLVYDLGGSSFEITVLTIVNLLLGIPRFKSWCDFCIDDYEITCQGADVEFGLGGSAWDRKMADIIKEKFCDKIGYNDEYDFLVERKILRIAEECRKTLSNDDKVDVFFTLDGRTINFSVTRNEFEVATEDLLNRTISLTQEAYDRAASRGYEINQLLLMGGAAKMPQVERAIRKAFQDIEIIINEPDEAVVKGTALYAYERIIRAYDYELN